MRTIYFSILIPHVALAAVVLPIAIVTLRRGLRRDDARHRPLARIDVAALAVRVGDGRDRVSDAVSALLGVR